MKAPHINHIPTQLMTFTLHNHCHTPMPLQPQNLPNTTLSKTPHNTQKHKPLPTTSIYLQHTHPPQTPHKIATAPNYTPRAHITLTYTFQAHTYNKLKSQHYHLQTQQVLQVQVDTRTFTLGCDRYSNIR